MPGALTDLIAFDRSHGTLVAGCDEAGRGCFAGPLVAAGVLLDHERLTAVQLSGLAALNDSKKLTAARRAQLYPQVLAAAVRVAVCSRAAASIDQRGLHRCNIDAMHSSLGRVAQPGAVLLSDGFALAPVGDVTPVKVIRGDATSAAIACASIIAKVTRDRLMERLAVTYPGYGFERHMGYGTKAHQAALAELGLTSQHRRSFKGVVELAAGARA